MSSQYCTKDLRGFDRLSRQSTECWGTGPKADWKGHQESRNPRSGDSHVKLLNLKMWRSEFTYTVKSRVLHAPVYNTHP